jgi:hypothetical protein
MISSSLSIKYILCTIYICMEYDQLLVCGTLATSAIVFKILSSANESIVSDLTLTNYASTCALRKRTEMMT